jgi:hypothetical protein
MGRIRTAAVALAAFTLLGCGTTTGPPVVAPAGDPVPADVLRLEAQEYGRHGVAALSTEAVSLRAFAGWFGRSDQFTSSDDPAVPQPGRTLLAVGGDTGCRLSSGVEVRRVGDDLRVGFTGGTASQTCTRPFGPIALLSVPTDAVAGIRTVNGKAPVAASGPGALTGFVRLESGPSAAVEMGHGDTALGAQLEGNAEARTALDRPVSPGTRAFAFVLTGCRETGAVLLVDDDRLSAEPSGGEAVTCYLPEYYLATFELPAQLVPEPLVLGD